MKSKMTILVCMYASLQLIFWISWWNAHETLSKGFCCGYVHSIQRILLEEQGEKGILSFALTAVYQFFSHPKIPLISIGCVYLFTGLYLWKKTKHNVLAMLMFFSMPAPFVAAHRLDFYVVGQSVLFLMWFLVQERSKFLLPMFLLIPFLSARSTDNILLVGAVVSFCAFKYPLGVMFSVATVFLYLQVADGTGILYYQNEFSFLTSLDFYQITAYGSYLFWRGVGFVPFLLCLFLSIRYFRNIPRMLWLWLLGCYIILTLTTKKNHYYIFVMWPIFPLLVFYATQNIQKSILYYLCNALLILWSLILQVQLFVPTVYQQSLSLIRGNSRWGGIFQTADGNLDASAQRNHWADVAVHRIQKYPPTRNLWCTSKLPLDELFLRLWLTTKTPIKYLSENSKKQMVSGDAVVVSFQNRNLFPNFEQMATFYDQKGQLYVYLIHR